MEHGITAHGSTTGGSPLDRTDQLDHAAASQDAIVDLGCAVALTQSSELGTVDDGEIHGAYRLKYRDK